MEGKSYLKVLSSTKLFFILYHILTTDDFSEHVKEERFSLKQERDNKSYSCNLLVVDDFRWMMMFYRINY